MTQVIQDLPLQIHLSAIALANLIQLINHITQIRADLLHFFVTLTDAIGNDSLTLTWVLELHALGEELAFILVEIDFQDIVVGFLTEAVTVNFIRISNAQTFQIIVHSGTLDLNITHE